MLRRAADPLADPAERHHRAGLLVTQLAHDVDSVATAEVAAWDRTLGVVAGPMADFYVSLSAWTCEPTEGARAAVRECYRRVVAAWKCAASEHALHVERRRAER